MKLNISAGDTDFYKKLYHRYRALASPRKGAAAGAAGGRGGGRRGVWPR